MNERINELLTKAGVSDNWNPADWYSMSPAMVQTFTELIVQESCSQIFTEVRDQRDQQFYDRVTANIKKHFGVRE